MKLPKETVLLTGDDHSYYVGWITKKKVIYNAITRDYYEYCEDEDLSTDETVVEMMVVE